jgi:hypothetical protein
MEKNMMHISSLRLLIALISEEKIIVLYDSLECIKFIDVMIFNLDFKSKKFCTITHNLVRESYITYIFL